MTTRKITKAPAKKAAPAKTAAKKVAAPAKKIVRKPEPKDSGAIRRAQNVKTAAHAKAPAKKIAAPARKIAAPAKKAAPAKSTANLTPLEKARLARAKGSTTAAKKKSTKPVWKAPADFAPALYEVQFKTDKDGFLASRITCLRIQGTYDKAPERNRRLVDKFDPLTLAGIAARIGVATYVSKVDNRLPANTQFRVLYRVGVRSADGTLSVTIRKIWVAEKNRKGVVAPRELERSDAWFRRIRRSTQFLPAAFATAIQPPKLARGETD